MEKETRYLISIGINDYELKPLDYCVKDSEDIVSIMNSHCNVDVNNIYSINSDDNKPNLDVYAGFDKAVERIKSKFIKDVDSIFFYFSGHGTQHGKSTSIVLHDKVIELQNIFNSFLDLKPKFIFCLIDSCFSGVGIEDDIGKLSNEFLFTQHLQLASGYNIICACAGDSVAKENPLIKNGRLTRVFIDIIKNKLNYKDGILNLSKVFQLVDEEFKSNPEFKQFPFAQTKGLSTYPIAFIPQTALNSFFSTHYILDIENYDWDKFKSDLSSYCLLDKNMINEFTRLIRELLRNSKSWGGATFLKIEISSDCVSIYDNSGTSFDIFNPPSGIRINGGGKTAKIFKKHFGDKFSYESKEGMGETLQIFSFINVKEPENICVWKLQDLTDIRKINNSDDFDIPDVCSEYTIFIPQGSIDLSSLYFFLSKVITISKKHDKPIILLIDKSDKLKDEFIEILNHSFKYGEHKVIIK